MRTFLQRVTAQRWHRLSSLCLPAIATVAIALAAATATPASRLESTFESHQGFSRAIPLLNFESGILNGPVDRLGQRRNAGHSDVARQPAALPNRRVTQQRPPQNDRQQRRGKQGSAQRFRPPQQEGRPGAARQIQRLSQMPPDERRRFLQNLPPRQRQQVLRRLQHWNGLSSEQRQEMLDREEIWQRMSPEQRRRVRQDILPQWRQLPPERRQALQRRLRILRPLSEDERAARLRDEDFLRGLSDPDRALLRALADLRLPPPDQDAPDQDSAPTRF